MITELSPHTGTSPLYPVTCHHTTPWTTSSQACQSVLSSPYKDLQTYNTSPSWTPTSTHAQPPSTPTLGAEHLDTSPSQHPPLFTPYYPPQNSFGPQLLGPQFNLEQKNPRQPPSSQPSHVNTPKISASGKHTPTPTRFASRNFWA